MPAGEFVIGRSSSCNLAVDDGLVSRRHAMIRVTEKTVTIEDLGSRNGVAVNGRRIEGPTPLSHLDRITIGNQEMVVLAQNQSASAKTLQIERCFICGTLNEPGTTQCTSCGTPLARGQDTLAGKVTLQEIPGLASGLDEPTSTSNTFNLLRGIADKALALGRYAEASRMLGPALDRLLESAREGHEIDDLQIAAGLVLRLCEGPTPERWFAWLFEIHALTSTLMKSEQIDRLHDLVRKARYSNPGPLREYLAVLGRAKWSVSERFLVRRLEALERVIVA